MNAAKESRPALEILIAEDSATQALTLRHLLENEGHRVRAAEDGESALRLLGERTPDVLITDIVMPRVDGYELCRRVRANERTRNLPVIFITSLSDPREVVHALSAGADYFVQKPCVERVLLARVRDAVANDRGSRGVTSSVAHSAAAAMVEAPAANDPTTAEEVVRVRFGDADYELRADPRRVIELLLSTYESAVEQNRELAAARDAIGEANRVLRERTEALEEINADLEAFAFSVSHDLKAPLRALRGFAEILEQSYGSTLGEEGKRIVGVITSSANKMGKMIDGLLEFSRLGKRSLSSELVDMELLFRTCWSEIESIHHDRSIEFRLDPLPKALGDEAALHEVVVNLLSNAAKFTRRRRDARIEVSAGRVESRAVYHIRDNGVGFNSAETARLFVPFSRLHLESEFEGSGIGLAIVRRVVERHGGTVVADAVPGEGAVFSFSLAAESVPDSRGLGKESGDDYGSSIQDGCAPGG